MRELFAWLAIDASFAKNTLGRPDYWAPLSRAAIDDSGDLRGFEFSCQHPRWHLTIQGSPLAVYMNYMRTRNLIVYILAHKEKDTTIDTLKRLMQLSFDRPQMIRSLLDDPFHIHLVVSNLSFEASKRHVEKFRRFMHNKMEQVHDHLEGVIKTDRSKLASLTAGLQVISQNADSHIANAEVAIMCAEGICAAHKRLHTTLLHLPPTRAYEATADVAEYILASLRKQKMWFINYKSRKDGAMNLVYNLVTQNDAENNLLIARDMRRDSASMSAIAALTMVFLPGTFTATIIDAGIFHDAFCDNDDGDSSTACVSGVWWLWLALTVPLTLLVIASWRIYHASTMIKRREGVVRQGKKAGYRTLLPGWGKQNVSPRKMSILDGSQKVTADRGAEVGV
ncbi:hypothetical protein DIS24_g9968 [Lasiodiplodia hormozganensis]|uniref:Uncharacterized protein n=1 Tax=Lasiodiplodia hormozganensis TaxID=869390 RepID=A0AA40CIC3_9PEZI|nr:hypothetical protein DIS24_g9968 [Lasiodiplodia hormozganensis]